jgi:hypothetical protein
VQKPELRWKKGLSYKRNLLFSHAIDKYGWHNFEHKIILEIEENDREVLVSRLNNLEEYEILRNNTLAPYGYNLDSGGKNKIPSDFTIQKMSHSKKEFYLRGGRVWNQGLKFSGMTGKNHTNETKLRMSKTRKLVIEKILLSGGSVGHAKGTFKHTEAARKKISLANMGKPGRNTGKHYYNDGNNDILSFECPNGYIRGRLKGHRTKIVLDK